MTTDWVNIISAVGFPIVLVLLGVNIIAKHIPTVLAEWRRFTVANESFAKTVERNTEITYKSYDESISVKDLLQQAIEKLDNHHQNATDYLSESRRFSRAKWRRKLCKFSRHF